MRLLLSLGASLVVGTALLILDLEAFGFGGGGLACCLNLVVAMVVGLGSFGVGLLRQQPGMRRFGLSMMLAAAGAFVLSIVVLNQQLARTEATGDTICTALEKARAANGHYPKQLQELVPAYLPEIPATSMGVFRRIPFDLRSEAGGGDFALGFEAPFFLYWARGRATPWHCDD